MCTLGFHEHMYIMFQLTWADVHVYVCVEFSKDLTGEDFWEKYPQLKVVKEKLESNPIIQEHIKTRPQMPF